jgi:ribosomal-protein-alanine N-acetyltransferase
MSAATGQAAGPGAVQAAGACDVALLAELNRLCFAVPGDAAGEPGGFVGTAWSARALAEVLALPGAFGFLALDGGTPAGFLLGQALFEAAEVLSFGVLPGQRRKGHGRRLLRAAAAEAARRGARQLHLEVAEDNLGARAAYAAAGFAPAGRRRNYYRTPGGTSLDALLYTLPLPIADAAGSDSRL